MMPGKIRKSIPGLEGPASESILRCLAQCPKVKAVILYGSRAKGNFRRNSDIDLTLEAPDMTLRELLALENQLDDLLLPWKIDLSLLHHIDNQDLLDHIHRVGVSFAGPMDAESDSTDLP